MMASFIRVCYEEELLPACSTSSRESNYHDSQGEINSFSQIRNALPTGLKKRLSSPCGSRHFMFRLSPSSLPLLRTTLLAWFRSFSLLFLLLPLSGCFPSGKNPWTQPDFPACNGPSAITVIRLCFMKVTVLVPSSSYPLQPPRIYPRLFSYICVFLLTATHVQTSSALRVGVKNCTMQKHILRQILP